MLTQYLCKHCDNAINYAKLEDMIKHLKQYHKMIIRNQFKRIYLE